jgi:hypothetical protein
MMWIFFSQKDVFVVGLCISVHRSAGHSTLHLSGTVGFTMETTFNSLAKKCQPHMKKKVY